MILPAGQNYKRRTQAPPQGKALNQALRELQAMESQLLILIAELKRERDGNI